MIDGIYIRIYNSDTKFYSINLVKIKNNTVYLIKTITGYQLGHTPFDINQEAASSKNYYSNHVLTYRPLTPEEKIKLL